MDMKIRNKNESANGTDSDLFDINEPEQRWYLIIYSALVIAMFITIMMRSVTFFSMCMKASINLHNKIFYRLLRAPISIFDNNPVGRILNRCTKDVGIVDEQLPSTAFDLNLVKTLAPCEDFNHF